jgi:hypothetical protein
MNKVAVRRQRAGLAPSRPPTGMWLPLATRLSRSKIAPLLARRASRCSPLGPVCGAHFVVDVKVVAGPARCG